MKYQSSLKAKLIYVFRINDAAHKGCLKIGEATLEESVTLDLKPNCHELNQAAKARISQYTKTASIDYDLLHTEITFFIAGGTIGSFNDKEVHDVLIRSGIKRHDFSTDNQGKEWFEVDLATVKQAIEAVKRGQSALQGSQITQDKNPIVFRPEQKAAINKTVKKFKKQGSHMLWNAKMRFGKTLSALQVVKECQFHRTMILTHRPVVDAGWFEDFNKIFMEDDNVFRYGSKNNGFIFTQLERDASREKKWHYVYFASMQDLRGSAEVGGKFDKNDAIFNAQWDCLIIDEAHEGTQTQLGQNVIDALKKEHTCVLNLSGTPFNLLDDFNEDEVYTWDYVMEQRAKQQWDLEHFGDPNPYAGLPRLNIFTFDLGKIVGGYADVEDRAFNFKEFFRTWTGDPGRDHVEMPSNVEEGQFIHEADVRRFLDLIVKYDKESNYPYSTPEYRRNFRHSLWMVPGVKEARALSALLQQHPIFSQFEIVNVAGEGDEEAENEEALKMVEKAMGDDPDQTFTITLSCGRLTTGVTVRPWTAVFMLAGSAQTDAKAYMQTIFRVQSPYETKQGRRKEECFVFDFAPDRTLKVIANVAKVTAKAGKIQSDDDRATMGQFLNFCPIIGYNGTKMEPYNVEGMLEQLKKAYVDRVVRHGFEDAHLYNDNLLKLSEVELKKFEDLKKIIGSTKANQSTGDIDINKQGLTDEEYEKVQKAQKKPKKELTEEEKRLLEELKQKKQNRQTAISILRGISIRFPLLIYGAELVDESQDVTIDNFAELIDDQSWDEFMPRGVTKEKFAGFIQYYDPDIFRAAGRQIRDMARAADSLTPTERVQRIASIFSYFRNPDKETVLTPWRVVNMHMSDCLGGYDFFDDTHDEEKGMLTEPRRVDQGQVTQDVFCNPDTRILEINSKTGLYPLYVAYSVFAERCQAYRDSHMLATDLPDDIKMSLWDKTLAENIFVICKTPMAKSITRRTLRGFRSAKVNARYFEDLINTIQNKSKQFIERISNGQSYWKANNIQNMKFNAIVGNPPYQVMDGGAQASAAPIYNHFVDIAKQTNPSYISMIMPARWYSGGRGLDEFREQMLNDKHIARLDDCIAPESIFPGTNIRGGICYFLRDIAYDNQSNLTHVVTHGKTGIINDTMRHLKIEGVPTFIRDASALSILSKVRSESDCFVVDIVSSLRPFGFRGYFVDDINYKDTPDILANPILCYGKGRQIGYVERELIKMHTEWIDTWKVIIPRANNIGTELNDDNLNSFLGAPKTICTESYLVLGADKDYSKTQCEHLSQYLSTKFARFMHSLAKSSQDATSKTFQFVPLQDFSEPWTDEKLYKKYNLSDEEISYIESLIKPME